MSRRCRAVLRSFCVASMLIGAFQQLVKAQANPTPTNQTGTIPYQTYEGQYENVNLATGGLSITIPLLSMPGRNGHDFKFSVTYNSEPWAPYSFTNPTTGQVTYYWNWGAHPQFAWKLGVPRLFYDNGVMVGNVKCSRNFMLEMPDGSKHQFPFATTQCSQLVSGSFGSYWTPVPGNPIDRSSDQDHMVIDVTDLSAGIVRLKDGTEYLFGGSLIQKSSDSNGNHITYNYTSGALSSVTDTVGRTITITSSSISYKDSNGIQRSIGLNYSSFTSSPVFQQPPSSPSATVQLLTSITLPNQRSYTFQYNTYGEMTKITYPAGGYTRYDYGLFNRYFQGRTGGADFRQVVAKHRCASSSCTTEENTTYTPSASVSYTTNSQSEVIDAMGNKTAVSFCTGTNSDVVGLETNRSIYQGTSTLLQTIQTTYTDASCSRFSNPASKVVTTGTVSARTEWSYDSWGNVTEQREYGFDGVLIRKTVNSWLATNPVNNQDYTTTTLNILNKLANTTLYKNVSGTLSIVAQGAYEYDNFAGTGGRDLSGAINLESHSYPGNLTSAKRWLNTNGTWLIETKHYDNAGNVIYVDDPGSHRTTYSYSDAWEGAQSCLPSGQAKAFPTTITNALGQSDRIVYYSCSGLKQSTRDQNDYNAGRNGTTYTYDLMGRIDVVTYPDGGITNTDFDDIGLTLTKKILLSSDPNSPNYNRYITAVNYLDGLGRNIQTRLLAPEGEIKTDSSYDAMGRVHTVSNAYISTSDPSFCVSTTEHDAIGRITQVSHCGTSSTNISYINNCSTVTDEASKKTKKCSDGLGRVTQVFEDSNGLNYETDYQYDVLSNLTRIDQKGGDPNSSNWRTRTFNYDSLSRLSSSSNPESGTVTYTYDSDGNIRTRTDARNITTTFNYDSLHRVTSKTYTDSGQSSQYFQYDSSLVDGISIANPVGRLVKAYMTCRGTINSYDGMGRPVYQRQWMAAGCPNTIFYWDLNYSYDQAGNILTSTNGKGVTLSYVVDTAGRVIQVKSSLVDAQHPGTLASSIVYTPWGALAGVTYGNGLRETRTYNARLQPTNYRVYDPNTGIDTLNQSFGYGAAATNNGNLMSWIASGQQTFNRSYGYDALNRLSLQSDSNCGLSFAYDAWGNRISQDLILGGCYASYTPVNNLNRITDTGYSYDASGNMIVSPKPTGGTTTYEFGAEGELKSVDGGATLLLAYDNAGHRVRKVAPSGTTLYVYDLRDRVVTEVNGSNGWNAGYVYLGGQLIAQYKNGTTYFAHLDHLGSTRVITTTSGTTQDTYDYQPFGEQVNSATTTSHKFTGKERDLETGMDYYGARYYASNKGRFISPDPVIVTPQRIHDPQQFNAYAYVRNSPLKLVDPNGMVLRISGDMKTTFSYLCIIAGDACDQLSYDADTGMVTFNTEGVDLSKNEGAALVNDIVQSSYTYDVTVGTEVAVAEGTLRIDSTANLDRNPDTHGARKEAASPRQGVDDQVAVNNLVNRRSETDLQPARTDTVLFHELAEAYAKVDHRKVYQPAHQEAIDREQKLRDQRPYLKKENPGAGPGDSHPIYQNEVIIKH